MKSFYRVPEEVAKDIEEYKKSVEAFLNGDIHPTKFRAQRVPRGVYEQRTNNTFMMRIRIPAGGITPVQMRCVSVLGKKYGNGVLHVTTRQDVQIHKVKLEDTPVIMEELLSVGLTTKGGGGNTVRNITACCNAGVCEKEAFDVSPYAIALTEHMIPDSRSYTLPRKFKVAFSGCPDDCAFATVNDVGFVAAEREVDGKKVQGFTVYTAGGMGFHSKVAEQIEEFVPAGDVADVCDAIKNLFDKNGNRKNKHKARLRFLIESLGKDEFERTYRQELNLIKKAGGTTLDLREMPAVPDRKSAAAEPIGNEKEYDHWSTLCVSSQKQEGYHSVKITVPLGEISSGKLASLADIVEQHGEGTVRSTHDQNFLFRFVHESELKNLFNALRRNGFALAQEPVKDIVCCAGSSTCRLGICLSRGMAEAISGTLEDQGKNLDRLRDIQIKISGCPNACGQHPIAKIGLFGAARRSGEKLAPYYMLQLGGRAYEKKSVLAESLGLAHVKDIPAILLQFLNDYAEQSDKYGDFYEYLEENGKGVMASLLKKHENIPSYEENPGYYTDWSAQEEFSLAGRGPGECGAGVFDMIEVDLDEADAYLASANSAENPAFHLYEAMNRVSRALLVTRGVEAKTDLDAFEQFEKEFIASNLVDQKFTKLMMMAAEYKKENLRDKALVDQTEAIKELVSAVRVLYNSMDDSLQFKKSETEGNGAQKGDSGDSGKGQEVFDLRGVECPFNYVKAKLKLETMEIGDNVELYLDEGEPIRNVPNSLKNDGQEITEMEKTDEGYYRLLVTKKM